MEVWAASLDLIFFNRYFETHFEHVPRKKLHRSTNFIIFGSTVQKLWRNKFFKRGLGWVGKCCANEQELTTCGKKCEQEEEEEIFKKGDYVHSCRRGGLSLVADQS
jgi:hypothetical protein